MKKTYSLRTQKQAGFTLVEMIVSIGLFAMVMVVCIGALLALTTANRKAQALQSVMDNLNITIDGMVRNLRMGTSYQCVTTASNSPGTVGTAATCDGVSTTGVGVEFKTHVGTTWIYQLNGGVIQRSMNGGSFQNLTSSDVNIAAFNVYVLSTAPAPADLYQPRVVFVIKGIAGSDKVNTTSPFHIQAMAVQRVLDI